ncbi:MAG: DegV family protein [Chloroflexi bacterium]|nr:DegV family protein [Chloroflexota bacterium]
MNKVAIVTDSTVAIPPSIVAEQKLTIVPLAVNWDGETYLDGIDITPKQFYERLGKSKTMPTTSQPSAGAFTEVYTRLLDEGYDILTLVISSKLSGTWDSAIQGAEGLPQDRLVVLNSLQASMPLSIMALMTSDAALKGASLLECKNLAIDVSERVQTLFVLETLEFLHRGGRIGAAARFLGTALKLKPILKLQNGAIVPLEKVRTFSKAIKRLFEIAERDLGKQGRVEYLGVLSANSPKYSEEITATARQRFRVKNEFVSEISPVIGTHTGPGAVGLVYLPERK